jgi:tRNA A37 threonylcarbamoyladenosine synthetase subunit TsaC/SUA5/YrdC
VAQLGNPIITTSIHDDDEILEYSTDPSLIHEKFDKLVDIVIDGGPGNITPSTVIDCTDTEPKLIREGLGPFDVLI